MYFAHLFILFCNMASFFAEPVFEAQVIDDNVSIGYGLAIGDVDGDGKPDILLADQKQFVWYRNGDWQRFVMAENLTERDNVCIAARDIDGDGKVEVAVGAQWNPGETSDPAQSGSVHYLVRPADPTKPWRPVILPHEPTIHRMRWIQTGANTFQLMALPLHGRGNQNGQGESVKLIAFEVPKQSTGAWKHQLVAVEMHLTHNLEIIDAGNGKPAQLLVGGKEGVKKLTYTKGKWTIDPALVAEGVGFGEVRTGLLPNKQPFYTGVEPMHGNSLTVYGTDNPKNRLELFDDMNQGHALVSADFLGLGSDQLAVGWRNPNSAQKVGVKLYVPQNDSGTEWKDYWIDDNGMACEDLQAADLDGDGKPELIASGRDTKNLKIYWNRSGKN